MLRWRRNYDKTGTGSIVCTDHFYLKPSQKSFFSNILWRYGSFAFIISWLFIRARLVNELGLSRLVKIHLDANWKQSCCLSCMWHGQKALNLNTFLQNKRRLISGPLWSFSQFYETRNCIRRSKRVRACKYERNAHKIYCVSQDLIEESIIFGVVYAFG